MCCWPRSRAGIALVEQEKYAEAKPFFEKYNDGKNAEVFRYDAQHAFVNEQRDVYDRAAAELAWGRTLKFWATHLGG